MKNIIGLALAFCLLLIWILSSSGGVLKETEGSNTSSARDAVVVLELFTSQGCSSCPPADELLARVRSEGKSEVFTISYHVDYWNYIGWEDPFSKPEYTSRQREYNLKFGSRSNYTPQLVVNGIEHFVGSDAAMVYKKIAEYSALTAENQIEISQLKKEGNNLHFNYKISGPIENKKLYALLVIDERTTLVSRGENRNRKLTNHNIVVSNQETIIGSSSGISRISLPDQLKKTDNLRLIALVENGDSEITAADRSELIQ